MKIRGNTIGTPLAPEAVLTKCNLTEEEKAQARERIGAVSIEEIQPTDEFVQAVIAALPVYDGSYTDVLAYDGSFTKGEI